MTITIEEVVTSTTTTLTWSGLVRADVALVVQHWFDDGSHLSAVDGEATGWMPLFYASGGAGWWKQYLAGSESPVETFVTAHLASIQMIGVRLRTDDHTPGREPFIDEAVEWGIPKVTDFADDPVFVWDGSDVGTGFVTCNLPLVTLATMANIKLSRSEPFQVPLGTTITIGGAEGVLNQQAGAVAFGAWTAPEVTPPVAGVGGWQTWIID